MEMKGNHFLEEGSKGRQPFQNFLLARLRRILPAFSLTIPSIPIFSTFSSGSCGRQKRFETFRKHTQKLFFKGAIQCV
jgi:peptidoglycan/LPS O-acetylase OafA/YrhL